MAIQVRRGQEANFDPSKMLPGEWAVSTDTRYVRMCFAPGIVVRMATYESFEADMAQIKQILSTSQTIQQVVTRLASEVKADTEIVVENTTLSKQYMEQAKTYAENASAVSGVEIATKDRAGLVKGGENTIAEDGTLELTRKTTDRELTDSYAGGLKINEVDGASEQAQYTGKNHLKINAVSQTKVGVAVTINNDGSITLKGTSTAWGFLNLNYVADTKALPTGNYLISGGSANTLLRAYVDGTQYCTSTGGDVSLVISEESTTNHVRIEILSNTTYNETIYPMIRPASVTDATFEPYVGGIASPSPEYPQPIKSVGDDGSLEIKTVGKNLVNATKENVIQYATYGDYEVVNNGLKSTGTYCLAGFKVPINIDKPLLLSYVAKVATGQIGVRIREYSTCPTDFATGFIQQIYQAQHNASGQYAYNYTPSVGTKWVLVALYADKADNAIENVMLSEVGGDFVPYQSNSITIPLSEPLRGIEEFKDRIVRKDGVYGIERNTYAFMLDGTESWNVSGVGGGYLYYTNTVSNNAPASLNSMLCEAYENSLSSLADMPDKTIEQRATSSGTPTIYIKDSSFATKEEIRNWFANNPTKCVAKLVAPTFEPFDTDTQIAINSLVTYDSVTYVSTNSEIEPVIEVEYGTSRVGGYALEALNTANRNELHISALTQLTNSISNTIVEREE